MSNDKADGWVAWHPMCGACLATAANTKLEARGQMMIAIGSRFFDEPVLSTVPPDGWRIRPVKLQFLDEPEADGWIKCSERLPGLGQLVLACDAKHPKQFPKIVYRDDDSPVCPWWWETLSGETWENIEDAFTHWMPLPEAPLVDENKNFVDV